MAGQLEVSYTVWKRCEQCGLFNNEKRISCLDCGLVFTQKITSESDTQR